METIESAPKEKYKAMTLDNFETELVSKKAKRLDLVMNQYYKKYKKYPESAREVYMYLEEPNLILPQYTQQFRHYNFFQISKLFFIWKQWKQSRRI